MRFDKKIVAYKDCKITVFPLNLYEDRFTGSFIKGRTKTLSGFW